jgi:hypothetical protein
MGVANGFDSTSITSTTTLKANSGVIKGFFVSANNAGTVTIYDNTAASGTTILASFTIPALGWYELGSIGFGTGLHVVIGGTSATVTVVYV